MSKKALFSITAFACLALADNHSATVVQDKTAKESFLQEAPAKWAEYCELARDLQVTIKTWNGPAGTGFEGPPHEIYEMKRNKSGSLLRWSFESDSGNRYCVANENYAFELGKRKKKTDSWLIKRIFKNRSHQDAQSFVSSEVVDESFGGVFGIYKASMPSVLKQVGFRVTNAKTIWRDGKRLIAVGFSCIEGKNGGEGQYVNGVVNFDPERFWAVVDFHGKYIWQGGMIRSEMQGTYEYVLSKTGLPIPKLSLIKVRGVQAGEPLNFDVKNEYVAEQREPSWEEFTLTAFGLPEPPGMPAVRCRSYWYLWVLAAAAVAIAVGWAFRRRMLRGANAPAPEKGIEI
ncbi:MAG: hypothetical protein HYX68_23620 [Planctomycetes bacterium]|nr:hypothetical protein [Planctomycetota bacterium]